MKFKALVRKDDGQVRYEEEIIENFDGTLDELLQHAHIRSAEVIEEAAKKDSEDLTKLNKIELKEKAAELGIEVADEDTKAQIIEKIEEKKIK